MENKVYHSEAAKVRDMPHVMKYITGKILDIGCGHDKITPDAIGVDGRPLEGVDVVTQELDILFLRLGDDYDTIFSSHLLEHMNNPCESIHYWSLCLKTGGHMVLYLPEKDHYNSHENPEHLFNWSYEDFLFFFRRCFCGEGKDFRGNHLPKIFELVDSGLDIGHDRYSFYLICRKL